MALAQQSEGLSVENWRNGTGTAIRRVSRKKSPTDISDVLCQISGHNSLYDVTAFCFLFQQ